MGSTVFFKLTYANMYGSQLVAALVNCFFFGIAFFVTLQYFRRHARKDPIYVRAMVGIMIVLATLQTIFVDHQIYKDIISKHNNNRGLLEPILFSLPGKFECVFLISFVAQVFFATRIWALTEHVARGARLAIVPILFFAGLQFASGTAVVNMEASSANVAEMSANDFWLTRLTGVQGAASAVCDVIITVTLCHLYRAHSSASHRIDSIVDRLIIYAINRAAATSLCAVLSVLTYFLLSGTYYFIVPTLMTGQLYVISVVSVLTSRESLRDDLKPDGNHMDEERGSVANADLKRYSTSEKSA